MLNYPEGKSSGEDLKHQGFWKILMLGILLQSAVAKNGVVKDDIYIYVYIHLWQSNMAQHGGFDGNSSINDMMIS